MDLHRKISAIAFDIDGTLLDSRRRLSRRNFSALKHCAENGVLLCVATARPKRLTFRAEEVPEGAGFLSERGVFYNGAELIDSVTGISRHWCLPGDLTANVIAMLESAVDDMQIAIQIREEHHSYRLPMSDEEIASWGFPRQDLLPFTKARNLDCSKIVAYHDSADLAPVYRDLVSRIGDRINAFITDSNHWIQIVSVNARKETALLHLFAQYGILPEHVAVLGNDPPDSGMFRTFGMPIAMANADDDLKKLAAFVTLGNDEDGVAHALERIMRTA